MATRNLGPTGNLDVRKYRCATKAVKRRLDGQNEAITSPQVRRGAHWVTARRAWLNIYEDRLTIGDWVVRSEDIEAISAQHVRSLGMKVTVLTVLTHDARYQLGINPWAKPVPHLESLIGESITPEQARLGWSFFSVAARIAFLGCWAWYLLSQVRGR